MVAHMKTTVDIADTLLQAAKERAHAEHRTLKQLIEDGLRRVLAEEEPKKAFKLKHHAFKGEGLQAGIREGDWETIRDIIYGLR